MLGALELSNAPSKAESDRSGNHLSLLNRAADNICGTDRGEIERKRTGFSAQRIKLFGPRDRLQKYSRSSLLPSKLKANCF